MRDFSYSGRDRFLCGTLWSGVMNKAYHPDHAVRMSIPNKTIKILLQNHCFEASLAKSFYFWVRNKWISKIFVLKALGKFCNRNKNIWILDCKHPDSGDKKRDKLIFKEHHNWRLKPPLQKNHKTSKCTWPQVPSHSHFYLSYIVWISLWFSSFCQGLYKTWTSNVMKEGWKKRSGNNLSGFIQIGLSLWRKVDLDICQHFNIVSSSVTTLFNSFKSN